LSRQFHQRPRGLQRLVLHKKKRLLSEPYEGAADDKQNRMWEEVFGGGMFVQATMKINRNFSQYSETSVRKILYFVSSQIPCDNAVIFKKFPQMFWGEFLFRKKF